MDWVTLLIALINLVKNAVPLPDWDNEDAIVNWRQSMLCAEAKIIWLVAGLFSAEDLDIENLQERLTKEASDQGVELDPKLTNLIVQTAVLVGKAGTLRKGG